MTDSEEEAEKIIEHLSGLTCYKFKIELLRASGFNDKIAKVIGIYTSAFPHYSRYIGGNYVAS